MREISKMYFDFGNSRVKWSFDGESQEGAADYADIQPAILNLSRAIEVKEVIVVASVASEEKLAPAINVLRDCFPVPIRRCLVTGEALGVRCGYADINSLGIDRWLAVLAVWQQSQTAALVVDLGTAATLDVIDSVGQHRGGYIVSGIGLSVAGLLGGTDKIKAAMEQKTASDLAFGCTTTEAVRNGALRNMVALIAGVYADVLALDRSARLILAGGDAELVGPLLDLDYEIYAGLVFKGMDALDNSGMTESV